MEVWKGEAISKEHEKATVTVGFENGVKVVISPSGISPGEKFTVVIVKDNEYR